MSGAAGRRGFDPRFDPRFQPGYDPVADAAAPPLPEGPLSEPDPAVAEPVAEASAAPPEPVVEVVPAAAPDDLPVPGDVPPVRAGGKDRARPWILAGMIAAGAAILIGWALVWGAATSVRVIQPTGTVDQGVMVQVASQPLAPSLIEGGLVALVVLLVVDGIRRAAASPPAGRGAAVARGAVVDRSVTALAVIAVLGAALAAWSATWHGDPVGSVSYFGAPTYDDLWLLRIEILAPAAASSATIAAVGGCLGIVIVVVARLRAR